MQQVRQALRMGVLDVGDQLPSVREVVAVTAINPNTVLKAYRDLEREGLVAVAAGRGTFVTKRPDGPPPGTHARLGRSLAHWVREARAAGLDDESIESLLRVTLRSTPGVPVTQVQATSPEPSRRAVPGVCTGTAGSARLTGHDPVT